MEILLAGAGMLACLVLMMAVIPLGRRLFGRAGSGSGEDGREADDQEDL
jgi:hypothetical protein